jgi:hypothetical protein
MSILQAVDAENRTEQNIDVVFVHGLGGNAMSTWLSASADLSTYWPRWLAQDCPAANLWTLDYDAEIFSWLGA